MHADHRRYLVAEQGVGGAVFNFVLNGVIAWGFFRGLDRVPLWGDLSIAGDTIVTGILLPFLTCLVVTWIEGAKLRSGKLRPLGWTRAEHPILRWLPRRTLVRGLVLALVCTATLTPATIVALGALGVDGMSLGRFLLFKATWAGAVAALVVPLTAAWAIAEPPPGAAA
jgi:hypothetical protein